MSVFAIADLHLSLHATTNKSMEVFGNRWRDYVEKLEKNWRAVVAPEDTVILPGDISWALSLDEAKEDLSFLHSLPGQKIIGKGNHDFYWQTMRKLQNFADENGLTSLRFLYNNAFLVEDMIICGSRGWFYDAADGHIPEGTDHAKISAREATRLSLSLDAAKQLQQSSPSSPILAFMHFPVIWSGRCSNELLDVLLRYNIDQCYFGHIHGSYDTPGSFCQDGIRFTMISADYLNFVPKRILPKDTQLE